MHALPTNALTRTISFRAPTTTTRICASILRSTLGKVVAFRAGIFQSTLGKGIALPGTHREVRFCKILVGGVVIFPPVVRIAFFGLFGSGTGFWDARRGMIVVGGFRGGFESFFAGPRFEPGRGPWGW